MNKRRNIVIAVLVLLMIAVISFYIFDIVANGASPTDNLFRVLAMICVDIAAIIRVSSGGGRPRSLSFYEKEFFKDEIKTAFSYSPKLRKKLLIAARYYGEGRCYDKSMKILLSLKNECREKDDFEAVGVFLALTLTDTGLMGEAVKIYEQLIEMDIISSTIMNNLGHLYKQLGDRKQAKECYEFVIRNDPEYSTAYNNLAQLHFDDKELDSAKSYAHKAVELDGSLRPPVSLLAIIYAMEDNKEESEKYFHRALTLGEDANALSSAIQKFKISFFEEDEEDTQENIEE